MKATQRALSRVERNAALHQPGIQPVALEFLLAPRARKEAALIPMGLNVNLKRAGYLGFLKRQGNRPIRSFGGLIRIPARVRSRI